VPSRRTALVPAAKRTRIHRAQHLLSSERGRRAKGRSNRPQQDLVVAAISSTVASDVDADQLPRIIDKDRNLCQFYELVSYRANERATL
jgi:hypothetical protein